MKFAQERLTDINKQLEKLISQRNQINSNIKVLGNLKKAYEWTIQNGRKVEHKNTINQVERLLGICIISIVEYVYDNILNNY